MFRPNQKNRYSELDRVLEARDFDWPFQPLLKEPGELYPMNYRWFPGLLKRRSYDHLAILIAEKLGIYVIPSGVAILADDNFHLLAQCFANYIDGRCGCNFYLPDMIVFYATDKVLICESLRVDWDRYGRMMTNSTAALIQCMSANIVYNHDETSQKENIVLLIHSCLVMNYALFERCFVGAFNTVIKNRLISKFDFNDLEFYSLVCPKHYCMMYRYLNSFIGCRYAELMNDIMKYTTTMFVAFCHWYELPDYIKLPDDKLSNAIRHIQKKYDMRFCGFYDITINLL